MRTIMPFASSPLALQMSPTQTTETHEHLPTALNPQELSRSASPQQSNLSLLASISLLSSRARTHQPTSSARLTLPLAVKSRTGQALPRKPCP